MALVYDDATGEFRDTNAPRTTRTTTTRRTTTSTSSSSSSSNNSSSGGDGCFDGCLDSVVNLIVLIFKAFIGLLIFGVILAMCS